MEADQSKIMEHMNVFVAKSRLRMTFLLAAAACCLGWAQASSAGEWITIKTENDESLQAYVGIPAGTGRHPAVVYSHGALVRRIGAENAAAQGYDVREFVDALVAAGYAAIAPVTNAAASRPSAGSRRGGREMNTAEDFLMGIEQGMRAAGAAIAYLQGQAAIDPGRVGMIGFSEGGLVATWMAGDPRLRAIVIMSPALMRSAASRNIESATLNPRFEANRAPILVTMGSSDERTVMFAVRNFLIPRLRGLDKPFQANIDYPGGHDWFYAVRPEYWNDIRAFLSANLK